MPRWQKLLIKWTNFALLGVQGLGDALSGRRRPRFEFRAFILAPRDDVWRLCTSRNVIFHSQPVLAFVTEPLPGEDGLVLTRALVDGRPEGQVVSRQIERDDAKGISIWQAVPHALAVPPEGGHDLVSGVKVEAMGLGTGLTVFYEYSVRSFRDRIVYPMGCALYGQLIKKTCEHAARSAVGASVGESAAALAPRPSGMSVARRDLAAGVRHVMSISRAARVAVAAAVLAVAVNVLLPTEFERHFDQNLSHYQLAASFAQRDPALRKLLLTRSEAAYNKGGWPAAQSALDAALAAELMVYADDEHVLAITRHTLRVLGRLEATPAACKAYLLTGARPGAFPEAEEVHDEDVSLRNAALQNGFDRKLDGAAFRPISDAALTDDTRSLSWQPLALSQRELQALDSEVDGDAALYCSGSIKRWVNLLARPPREAARIERQFIHRSPQDDGLEIRDALCRRADRPGDCPQAAPAAPAGHATAIRNGGGKGATNLPDRS
ncbi:MAG TPA: hypothetical protein VGG01_20505 [Xanthobacteraceae bacterium]|jgi:hypothetical protein